MPEQDRVIRLKPRQYAHVLDNNTGVARLEVGPRVLTLQDHELLALAPQPMLVIPPRHYVTVRNPVVRDGKGEPERDRFGQVRLREGDFELRFEQEPFPLYPGEALVGELTPLQVVGPNEGLRLRALRDFSETSKEGEESNLRERCAGEEWIFRGPGTYRPRIEVELVARVQATILKPNQALHLRAKKAFVDRTKAERKAGEEWLVRSEGAYLPEADEEVVGVVNAHVLTERTALHLSAVRTFNDVFGRKRRAGDQWLVTLEDAETHLVDVYEKLEGVRNITTLSDREWCIVADPIGADGRVQLGKREVRRGRASFFLHPGERLEQGVQKVYVLGESEALLLRATEAFSEGDFTRKPGDRWMVYGPTEFIPRIELEVLERRSAIPLDKNEGIYVRNVQSGELRLERGPRSYLLTPYEELWAKELPPAVEALLHQDPVLDRFADGTKGNSTNAARDKTRAVVYQVPQGAACQVFDYKRSRARVVFGPDLVMLEPDEAFTVLSLSGGRPKRAKMHQSLAMLLGPDFMVDVIVVETSDHAQLRLQLAYNWHFDVGVRDEEAASRLFQVPDYVGDACNSVASRIRGAVAGVRFEEFHRHQAKIIREAVFGTDAKGGVREELRFKNNNLVISNIDIQSVEPVDEQTRASLQRSVQIAIKITTDAQEAAARHDAERLEQEAKARLERQQIADQREAESVRRLLLELQSESAAVQATGKASADARAKAESDRITGEAMIELARQQTEAEKIRHEAHMTRQRSEQEQELQHRKALNELEVTRAKLLSEQSSEEFRTRVAAMGPETLRAMAQAGPELQAKLLQALGLQSVLITDGKAPINLFQTAQGLVGATPTK